jgi:hypothetical protein
MKFVALGPSHNFQLCMIQFGTTNLIMWVQLYFLLFSDYHGDVKIMINILTFTPIAVSSVKNRLKLAYPFLVTTTN